MSEVRVMAWNVQDGLAKPGRAKAIAEKVHDINPDIAILSEGTPEKRPIVTEARKILEELGVVHVRPYDDIDGRKDRHSLVAVARAEFGKPTISLPLGRAAMTFPDANGFRVAGLHGFDRYDGDRDAEGARKRQLSIVINQALRGPGPAVILGDLNAMHAGANHARLLQMASKLTGHLAPNEPELEQSWFERGRSLALRLGSMATGDTLLMARDKGFVDADIAWQPTVKKGPIGVQLDHILVREAYARSFTLHAHDGLSDHKAISATIVA